MNQELRHTRITTRTQRLEDPSIVDIHKESYTDELNTREQQIEKSIITSHDSLATDVLSCLREITGKTTTELTIRIETDKITREPKRIIKTWTIHKEYLGKR